jgi:formylglycine-generating enzyme required for sulfatase activity
MHFSRMKGRSFVRSAAATILKRAQLALLLCSLLGIASKLFVSGGTLVSRNATGSNPHEPSRSQTLRKAPPPAHFVQVQGFWIDEHDVTNAEFSKFIEATAYVTTAEHKIAWENLKKDLIVSCNKRNIGCELSQVGIVSTRTDQCLVVDLRSS